MMDDENYTSEYFEMVDKIEQDYCAQDPNFSIMPSQLVEKNTATLEKDQSSTTTTTNDAVAEELQAFRDKLLPKTSKKEYESRFSKYTKWLKEKHPKLQPNDPNALKIYFNYLELNCAASSVISIFSAIRSIVKVKYQMDIIDLELTTALKKISKAHKYRKSLVFEEEQIEKFLIEAPEQEFGYFKLIWLVGFYGGCRKCELYNLQFSDLKKENDGYYITIQKSKTDPAANGRTFQVL